MDFNGIGDAEIQKEVGLRLKRQRLNINMSQDQLAQIAGVSRRTVTNTENGNGCSLLTLIAMLRGLGLISKLDSFIPDPGISPIQLSRLKGKQRRRASTEKAGKDKDSANWEWK